MDNTKRINFDKKYAYYPSPLGLLEIGFNEKAVLSISINPREQKENTPSLLSDRVFSQLHEYFDGKRKTFDFPIELDGTPFQKKVWGELLKIPYGETRSYKEIAQAIGCPNACRAVGGANNKNPVIIVVPCHRVIGADGKLVGYAGGLELKKRLLEIEKR